MRRAENIGRRERNINTPEQLLVSLAYSVTAHVALVAFLFLVLMWNHEPKTFVPGYRVNLVSVPTPQSLLTSPGVKKKRPKLKKAKKSAPKKKISRPKKKKISKAKKIVPKKKVPAPIKKAKPQEEKKEVVERLAEKKKVVQEEAPKKTLMAEGLAFPHIWYLKIVERKVTESWITHGLDIAGKRTDPSVQFTILKDGSVERVAMVRSSGSRKLDGSVVDAIYKSAPFPPLPEDFPEDSLRVTFDFSYEQHE
ncbi:hypothetical protein MNBD_NITROSPINAE01-674 [hydrothermal vent metagenome]|uniref:TonB C-terminal domain-containing protein n=1 Tax=hydrothermal vent metagenome TaxID=652676 RepID=A0A3B1C621_9ZZZZ